ncbi:MAG: hypothetical protein JWN28_325 [Candidatus Saccharibacteria bacterium]|nr:hypothetical protein [Candidatus Saccharibacteria bacterium]
MASPSNKGIGHIGIISEDSTDFETIRILISKIVDTDGIGFKSKVGNGCAKIRSKCVAWAQDLKNRKCDILIVVHDLDRNDHKKLKAELTSKLSLSAIRNNLVCIPVEEIEAWLIADPIGIKTSLGLKRIPRFSGNPETITSPKEKLREAIFQCSGKEIFYQTSINPRIAGSIDISLVYNKCPSFKEFYDYIKTNVS